MGYRNQQIQVSKLSTHATACTWQGYGACDWPYGKIPSLHVEGYRVSQSIDSGAQVVNLCPSLHMARIWGLGLAMWETFFSLLWQSLGVMVLLPG